jgi:hypothetical protein
MRNISDKIIEKINTHILSSLFFFRDRTVYEVKWKNIVEPDRPQMTIWCMYIVCSVPKATNTDSECVILIAFPVQQWLRELATMLRFRYIACLVHKFIHYVP